MQHLAAGATGAGATVSADTRIDRLVMDDGRVVGVQGQRYGETVSLRARRGVVLTAGGFIFNDDMLRQHCPPLARGTFKVGTEGDDGRGVAWPRPSVRRCATCTPVRCRYRSHRPGR